MAEPVNTVRRETVNSDILNPPIGRLGRHTMMGVHGRRIQVASIMAVVEGFARDGIGASWRGFEIFIHWTSYGRIGRRALSGKTRFDGETSNYRDLTEDSVSSLFLDGPDGAI
ncbi:hypothetical protein [Mesorhizobium sp. INR15]|uniref:hypothetical protein n=1 Tax=Mesorhizobium sp. INR15 TaxID=2654248 RepID=UPI0018966236|nr:hypothetical protein [Mesorhizobium sp. INR15]